jgi:hypothetical protein
MTTLAAAVHSCAAAAFFMTVIESPSPFPDRQHRWKDFMLYRFAIVAFIYIFSLPGAMAIEEPEFEILLKTPDYEVRSYAPYLVAEVEVRGSFAEAGNGAFRILAAYIFGENEPGEKMQMTAPVLSRSDGNGTPMAMTIPVLSRARDAERDTFVYGFVMGAEFTMESLPKPKDPRVQLRLQDSRIMAVKTYSGRWTEENYRQNESKLLAALAADGVTLRGGPILARYNSPFTPWFLRRNEALVEVEWNR